MYLIILSFNKPNDFSIYSYLTEMNPFDFCQEKQEYYKYNSSDGPRYSIIVKIMSYQDVTKEYQQHLENKSK